ncbi:hypothetical protein AB6A40_008671 [Gnathostoma spinigerum]|uniref:SAM-dependent MTase RsmB/NOP-type domain-containing protein n=1 Tax=Gnathostoma spinigerum TaxID=75299 RepID=A0ABD6EZ21_9BILA
MTEAKRTQFGTRYLVDEDKVFEHNAWDHVEWNEGQEAEAVEKVEFQRKTPVLKDDADSLLKNAASQWDLFYSKHETKFFMDRNWLLNEFPELDITQHNDDSMIRILEVGCGVGNTVFPLLEAAKPGRLFINCCDYSPVAVSIVKSNRKYSDDSCHAFLWDISGEMTNEIPEDSLDYILCIYVLSALPPDKHSVAVKNLARLLKPGGALLFKDYGVHDLTQLRFKKNRYIDENFYRRGDGTLVYFFTQSELDKIFTEAKLTKELNIIDRRLINKKQLLRLSCETLKHRKLLDELLKDRGLRSLCTEFGCERRSLLNVLLYEFIYGNGLRKASRELSFSIFENEELIRTQFESLQSSERFKGDGGNSDDEEVLVPRYARVNTLVRSVEETVAELKTSGWKVKRISNAENDSEYRNAIKGMSKSDVYFDPHIDTLLIFPPRCDLHDHWMVNDGTLVLQDKASCLPAFLLNAKQGCDVYDTCAAPGMKTSHLAAIMSNQGTIWASDRTNDRVETLRSTIRKLGVNCVKVLCGDFLRVDVSSEKFKNVQYALVDPPCSGSGIVKRMDKYTNFENDVNPGRLRSLANLQAMLLKHALKFPSLKKLVYSTCSVYEEENEKVIEEILTEEELSKQFKLKNAYPKWIHRGSSNYAFGRKCLRAHPDTDLTNGFFIAVFKRRKNVS